MKIESNRFVVENQSIWVTKEIKIPFDYLFRRTRVYTYRVENRSIKATVSGSKETRYSIKDNHEFSNDETEKTNRTQCVWNWNQTQWKVPRFTVLKRYGWPATGDYYFNEFSTA